MNYFYPFSQQQLIDFCNAEDVVAKRLKKHLSINRVGFVTDERGFVVPIAASIRDSSCADIAKKANEAAVDHCNSTFKGKPVDGKTHTVIVEIHFTLARQAKCFQVRYFLTPSENGVTIRPSKGSDEFLILYRNAVYN